MVGQDIVHARHSDDGAHRRVGPDIGYLFSQAPYFPSVIQTFKILFYCFYHPNLSFRFMKIPQKNVAFLKTYTSTGYREPVSAMTSYQASFILIRIPF
jgi:hypothetical protein